jgi:biofilm PGA synthesis N-glycosyltransferase PgaC
MILVITVSILFILYSVLVLYYGSAWRSTPYYNKRKQPGSLTKFAVVIAARNEASNISQLLIALAAQTYPSDSFEVIVVDDHSQDDTVAIANSFPGVKVISLHEEGLNSYKKKAIETGIAVTDAQMIVTTDADCTPGPQWLETIASLREDARAVFIVAPVTMHCNASILQTFQAMDFMVLQAITGAAVSTGQLSMCNGANLAYERNVFYEVGGFSGIDHIASGDDMLLMHKVSRKYPGGIAYLKSAAAIVDTQPVNTWKAFFNQRIRWASKASRYDDKRIFWVLLLVYLFNLSFLVLLIAGCWNYYYWILLLILWLLKTLVELPLLAHAADFFNKRWATRLLFFFQPLHILYTICAGFFGQLGKYEWKGRTVR